MSFMAVAFTHYLARLSKQLGSRQFIATSMTPCGAEKKRESHVGIWKRRFVAVQALKRINHSANTLPLRIVAVYSAF